MADTPRLDRSLSRSDRVRYRANRIDGLGSSHSNVARALAKDSLVLLEALEKIASQSLGHSAGNAAVRVAREALDGSG